MVRNIVLTADSLAEKIAFLDAMANPPTMLAHKELLAAEDPPGQFEFRIHSEKIGNLPGSPRTTEQLLQRVPGYKFPRRILPYYYAKMRVPVPKKHWLVFLHMPILLGAEKTERCFLSYEMINGEPKLSAVSDFMNEWHPDIEVVYEVE